MNSGSNDIHCDLRDITQTFTLTDIYSYACLIGVNYTK